MKNPFSHTEQICIGRDRSSFGLWRQLQNDGKLDGIVWAEIVFEFALIFHLQKELWPKNQTSLITILSRSCNNLFCWKQFFTVLLILGDLYDYYIKGYLEKKSSFSITNNCLKSKIFSSQLTINKWVWLLYWKWT